MKYKLAILTSHPIQYQTPLFRKIARHPKIDLTVYFCCDYGVKEKKDSEFKKTFKWDIPLLEGYKYRFLKNWSLNPKPTFLGQINFEIIKELSKNKFDIILINGWMSLTNLLTFLKNVPIILKAENPLTQELLKPKWKIKIKKRIFSFLFKKIKAFLYIGEENKEFYKFYGVPEEKLFFSPYAVDNERFIESYQVLKNKKGGLKKKMKISPKNIVILFCGKLIPKKRPLDLLFAYEKVEIPNKSLIFIGEGELKKEIQRYVKERKLKDVYITGFVNQKELPEYYIIGDIFVLPSGMGETWGLVVNEAMCFKLPIIVSDIVGCAKDLVKYDRNGYTYPMGDVEKLASYLEILINDENKRKKFGEESFKIVQGYSYQKDIEGVLKALESIKR